MSTSSNPKTSFAVAMILSDIPLLCEGIMGIGIFTFLFIVKQVGCLTCLLYGSSFLTFVAATLDLCQAITFDQLVTADGNNLDSFRGLARAREVFLAFAGLFLNLYIWKLVARCDHEDYGMATKIRPQSWDRVGIPGRILKWASLTALLTAPVFQIVWKLVPSQHQYSPVYVGDAVIEATLASAFILKLVLNAYFSPNSWWQAFRSDIAPITALVIGVGLGIGNLILFSLTETSQGRLLRAVEVYLFFLHNLCTTFWDVVNPARGSTRQASALPSIRETEKEPIQFVPPLPYNVGGTGNRRSQTILKVDRKYGAPLPAISYTWASQTKTSAALFKQRNRLQTQTPPLLDNLSGTAFALAENHPNSRSGTATPILKEEQPLSVAKPQLQIPPISVDPPLGHESLPVVTEIRAGSPDHFDVLAYTAWGQEEREMQENTHASQRSVSSLDEIIHQQNELDKRIAALRVEHSVAPSLLHPELSEFLQVPANPVRSTLRNSAMTTLTEGTSSNSAFSLSIFPEPPVDTMNENSDNDNIVNRPAPPRSRKKRKRFNDPRTSTSSTSLRSISGQNRFNSTGTQWDVTSFIGNLTLGQPPGTLKAIPPDFTMEETRVHSTVIGPHNVALRPLILASGHRLPLEKPNGVGAPAATDLPLLLSPAGNSSGVLSVS